MSINIENLINAINIEIESLKYELLKNIPNETIYKKRLEKNLEYIKWVNKKLNISFGSRKYENILSLKEKYTIVS